MNASNHTKCVSLSNQKCITQSTLIKLHPNEYTQGLHFYPLAFNLARCVRSCNTLNDLSNKVCVPNKTKDLNLNIFNMITEINEPKTLTKHRSCKYKFDCKNCNSNQNWNDGKCRCECKNPKTIMCTKKFIFRILLHVLAKMVNI